MDMVRVRSGSTLCCKCGVSIRPNAANTCVRCLGREFDITEGFPISVGVTRCPICKHYLQPTNTWIEVPRRSKGQLDFCIKMLPKMTMKDTLKEVVEVGLLMTPEIKVRLTVKKEVYGVELVKEHVVEYPVAWSPCTSCSVEDVGDRVAVFTIF